MFLLGSVVNALVILLGSVIGLIIPSMPDKIRETTMQGLSLAVILIGLSMALADTKDILFIIISLVVGGLLGELINIDGGLVSIGKMLERGSGKGDRGQIAEGFVTASLVFCVGAMSIVGAIQSGIEGVHKTLFAKSLLDLVSSIVFSTTLGIGVALAAVPVLIYEGAIAAVSHFVGAALNNPPVISCMTATGGLLIVGIGINILGMKKVNVGNLLPAMFIAPVLKGLSPLITHWVHL